MRIRDCSDTDLKAVARCLQKEKLDRKRKFQLEMRSQWLSDARRNFGLAAKVATEGRRIVAFAEYLPIEHAPAPITGHGLYYVNCVHVNHESPPDPEVGKALMKEMEEDIRSKKATGVAAVAHDLQLEFASVSFYRSAGYREVARGGTSVVMLKKFRNGSAPRFTRSSYEFHPEPGKIIVDAFWSSASLRASADIYNIRKVCKHFKSKVVLNEYNAADSDDKHFAGGIIRALSINGRWLPVSTLPEVTEQRVTEAIEKALARLQASVAGD